MREKTFSRIGRKGAFRGMLNRLHIVGVVKLSWVAEKFVKVFFLESFLLYGMQNLKSWCSFNVSVFVDVIGLKCCS